MAKRIKKENDMVSMTFQVPREIRANLKIQAAKEGRTMHTIILKLVEGYLKQSEKEDGRS